MFLHFFSCQIVSYKLFLRHKMKLTLKFRKYEAKK